MVSHSVCLAVGDTPPGVMRLIFSLLIGTFFCFPLAMVGGLGDLGLDVFNYLCVLWIFFRSAAFLAS